MSNQQEGGSPITSWTDPVIISEGPGNNKFYKIIVSDDDQDESRSSNFDWICLGTQIGKISWKNNVNNYNLSQNYPNPFNPSTQVDYSLKDAGFVQIKIFDILGRSIATLEEDYKEAGNYSIRFYGGNLPSGLYFYSLRVNSYYEVKKMVLAK